MEISFSLEQREKLAQIARRAGTVPERVVTNITPAQDRIPVTRAAR
jgi:hypothetical protein